MVNLPPTADGGQVLGDMLRETADRLGRTGIDQALLKAEHLIAHLLGCPRLNLPLHARGVPDPDIRQRIVEGADRLEHGEPLQYVLGNADFMGLRFRSDRRALIPRPETETLVERVLADPRLQVLAAPRIADIGTGTGCIVLALAVACGKADLTATDLVPETLTLARENARILAPDARIEWIQGDGLSMLDDRSFDVVVSNPPYVSDTHWADLDREVRDFEPKTALAAGPDGMRVIRSLVEEAPRVLDAEGVLFLECGEQQTDLVETLMEQNGFVDLRTDADLAGRPRIVSGRRPI